MLRDMLPFYSIGHFAFAAFVLAGVYVMMLRLDPPTASVVAFGSLLGMAAVGTISKPAWMVIARDQVDTLEGLLAEQGYRHQATGEWVPPLPKWLRCNYNKIEIRPQDGEARVTGLATILRGLANELNRSG